MNNKKLNLFDTFDWFICLFLSHFYDLKKWFSLWRVRQLDLCEDRFVFFYFSEDNIVDEYKLKINSESFAF